MEYDTEEVGEEEEVALSTRVLMLSTCTALPAAAGETATAAATAAGAAAAVTAAGWETSAWRTSPSHTCNT